MVRFIPDSQDETQESGSLPRPTTRIQRLINSANTGGKFVCQTLGFRVLKGRWRWYILATCLLGAGGSAYAATWAWQEVESSLPTSLIRERTINFTRSGALTIKAADGFIIHQAGPVTHERVKIKEVPEKLIQAFVAIEDRRFYEHDGVDYQGIIRAIVVNITSGRVVEGGSTLTQQLARIVFLDQEKNIWRKLRESRMAQKIEQNLTKDEVLERYLNLVYLGSGSYGVVDAAWVYFGKKLSELTLPEMATLAGLAPAPTEYSPIVDMASARRRRNIVLRKMREVGFITEAEARAALNSPLVINPQPHRATTREAPYFVDYIKSELPKVVTPETLANGGLIVETTLNRNWQKAAEQAVIDSINEDGQYDNFTQGSLVAIDPRNGEIKVMVGGKDYDQQKFNRATQAQRQPGSTFKTFLYTTAIAAGFPPEKAYPDLPLKIDDYEPKNFGNTYRGSVSMKDALTSSINVVAVRVLLDVGWKPVINMAQKMGIKSPMQEIYSLVLGSSEVNVLEITSAYGTLANKGGYVRPHGIRRVIDQNGKVIYDAFPVKEQAVDSEITAIVTWMLEAVVTSGTGTWAALPDRQVAGKTGTTDDSRDLWFVGYIPQLVAGVWLGNDNNERTYGMSTAAARVWGKFMQIASRDLPVERFPEVTNFSREAVIKVEPIRPAKLVTDGNTTGQPNTGRAESRGGDFTGGEPRGGGFSEPRGGFSEPRGGVELSGGSEPRGGGFSEPAPLPPPVSLGEPLLPEPVAPAPVAEPIAPPVAPPSIAPIVEPIVPVAPATPPN